MKTEKDTGKLMFDTLSAQYKPLEKALKKEMGIQVWEMYQSMSYRKKIIALDMFAKDVLNIN